MATNLPKQVINLTKQTTKHKSALMKDEAFKSFMKYKGIAALLLKHIVPELNGMSEIEIGRSIKNIQTRKEYRNDIDLITDKIDLLPSEDGEVGEKNIRRDITFHLSVDTEMIKVGLTIGMEMQQETSATILDYDLVSRAIFYAAAMLRNTITADNKDYSQIHKVYSIWFCKKDVINKIGNPEVDNNYMHRYKILRAYEPSEVIPKGLYVFDKKADLMEVILIELSQLPDDVTNDKLGTILKSLFFQAEEIIPMINRTYNVNISNTVIEQEVTSMYEKQDFINEGIEIGKEIAREEGQLKSAEAFLKKQITKGKQFTEEQAIKFLVDNLDLTPELSKQAYENVMSQQ